MPDQPPFRIQVTRLTRRERAERDEVWRVCRYCNDEIPPSAPNMAYCDRTCKMDAMAAEMGMGVTA